jgi:hypothetical protein
VVHKAAEWQGMSFHLGWKQTSAYTVYQGDSWNDLLKEVINFDSVEEFWGIYVCYRSSVN